MSNDRAGVAELQQASPLRDKIDEVASRPLPAGADDLLSSLEPPPDAIETIYLSTPITTGPKLLEWLSHNKNSESASTATGVDFVREEVISENVARLGPLRDSILAAHPRANLIDPTRLTVQGWKQADYHRFWIEVIERFVDRIFFADGWELSTGCSIEYAWGLKLNLQMLNANGAEIGPAVGAEMLREASHLIERASRDSSIALAAADRAYALSSTVMKDSQLVSLAKSYNVASFVSFGPIDAHLRSGVLSGAPLRRSIGFQGAIALLLSSSSSGLVNIRTFRPGLTKGNPFYYGISSVDDASARVRAAAADGYYCIANETIDIHDGGVSGVTLGGLAEFAPDDTPRAVESGNTARLPVAVASQVLRKVYGECVELPSASGKRVEFSVHPAPTGHRRENVIVWEVEDIDEVELDVDVQWPNKFSELIGDKTFGLLIADAVGAPVPAATVINRRVAPFRFGRPTGTGQWWMRTAPSRQTPGHFTTTRGWTDPFALLAKEDPDGAIASVIAQEGVDARFSGATLPRLDGPGHIIEGVSGVGDSFMLGEREVSDLPESVREMVAQVLRTLEDALGAGVRIEWAVDGRRAWVLQLHRVGGGATAGVFNPGVADVWLPFDPSAGLDALGELVLRAQQIGAGIEVTRAIGLTSHVGDLLRKGGVPGRLRIVDG